MKSENFKNAFFGNVSCCVATCDCGKTFYDTYNHYDWEEGDFEALEKNKKAIGIDHAVGYVKFEGVEYVMHCDCWHKKAEVIIEFIDTHFYQIASYMNSEKQRKIDEANNMPRVNIL